MGFLADKKILITGVLSNRSIAYGVARACQREGATLAFTYVNDDLRDRVVKIAAEFGPCPVLPCDVARDDDIAGLFEALRAEWGGLDGLLHSIAFAPREALAGDYLDSLSREAFAIAHDISSYSFAALAKGARPLMRGRRASLLTLTYLGGVRSVPNYNVMGLAKASLEANVRYLAACLGPEGLRANGISAGPIKTLAAAGIGNFSKTAVAVRGDRAAAPRRDHRRGRQRRRVPPVRSRERDHRRDHLRRRRLLHGRGGRRGLKRAAARGALPNNMPSRIFDAVVVGGGHNGLTCAAYLAAAGWSVCVLERRGVVGGAAVTEEFHPGFRNSTASYTVSLLDPKVIRDLDLAAHGLAVVERPFANFLPLSARDGDYLKVGGGLEATQREVARHSRRDAEALPAYYAMLDRVAAVLRDLLLATPPNVGGGIPALLDAWKVAKRFRAARPRRPARRPRSLHEERGRRARPLVRVGADQGGVRLRRDRRQLREPVHAGLGLRAAAPRLRRGQRQAGAVGPRDRRHGRDHAGDGEGVRGTRRRDPHRRARRSRRRQGRPARPASSSTSGEVVAAKRVVANVNPKLLFERLVAAEHQPDDFRARIAAYKCGSGTFRMNVALAALPDFPALAGDGPHLVERHRHGALARVHGAGVLRREDVGLVARADRRDADPFARRRHAVRRRARTSRACSASTCIPTSARCSPAARGTMRATRSPT